MMMAVVSRFPPLRSSRFFSCWPMPLQLLSTLASETSFRFPNTAIAGSRFSIAVSVTNLVQLVAEDHSARGSMKTAATCGCSWTCKSKQLMTGRTHIAPVPRGDHLGGIIPLRGRLAEEEEEEEEIVC